VGRLSFLLLLAFLHRGSTQPSSPGCAPADAVVITCHGRSGSTLTERMFDLNPEAVSYYEPLRPWDLARCFNHVNRHQSLVQTAIATLSCNLSTPVWMRCPWHSSTASGGLMLPLDSVKPWRVIALGQEQVYAHRRLGYEMWATQLFNLTSSAPACRAQLSGCGRTVAAKTVRLTGMLDMLMRSAEAELLPTGRRIVIVHLIRVRERSACPSSASASPAAIREPRTRCAVLVGRGGVHRSDRCPLTPAAPLLWPLLSPVLSPQDPRALLQSRYRVGWGVPKSRRWLDIAKWAGKLCSLTLRDMSTGDQISRANSSRAVYIRMRYEDLVMRPLEAVHRVYRQLGKPVPTAVDNYFQRAVHSLGSAQPAAARNGDWRGRAARPPTGYVDPYTTVVQKSGRELVYGWMRKLPKQAVMAVQSRPNCQRLMRELRYQLLPK
jgi:hypothetical protein